jgi:hypothetical protein
MQVKTPFDSALMATTSEILTLGSLKWFATSITSQHVLSEIFIRI